MTTGRVLWVRLYFIWVLPFTALMYAHPHPLPPGLGLPSGFTKSVGGIPLPLPAPLHRGGLSLRSLG